MDADGPRPGNKLPDRYENPVDLVLLRVSERIQPWLRDTGHVPNTITTYSFVCGLAAVYALHRGHIPAFSVLFGLSYFFDCVDGQFARLYGMETEFGDWYDHATDLIVLASIAAVVARRYRSVLTPTDAAAVAVAAALMLTNFGCQQRVYAATGRPETLDACRGLCPSPPPWTLQWSRFFGSGTMVVVLIGFIAHLHHRRRRGASASTPAFPRRRPPS